MSTNAKEWLVLGAALAFLALVWLGLGQPHALFLSIGLYLGQEIGIWRQKQRQIRSHGYD